MLCAVMDFETYFGIRMGMGNDETGREGRATAASQESRHQILEMMSRLTTCSTAKAQWSSMQTKKESLRF